MSKVRVFGGPFNSLKGAAVLIKLCTYVVKHFGNNTSRNFYDGYPLKVKEFQFSNNYVSYVSHYEINIYFL